MNQSSDFGTSIIAIRDLRKSFGHVHALNGLSFTVNKGDIYGFLGPNGSGKSTTIRILLSLVKPDSGIINLFDQSMKKSRRQILPRVGALIERPDFYGHISAFKNLVLLCRYAMTDLSEARILATLELVGLGDRAKDLVKTYSDGMKQRLGIAQALMHHPELLILDEPFNSLDPQGVKDIRDLIVKLNKEQGTTVLVSSHKLDEIEKVATRMVMISNGQSIAEGRVQDLISERVAAIKFIVESPSEAKRILEASDIECSNIEIDEKYLTVFSNKDNIPRLVEALVSGNIKIYSVSDNHSLEELFLSLTSSL